ncbi:MAG TPA: CBS domain-containing protein [Verrucomicrobiae bacterium]
MSSLEDIGQLFARRHPHDAARVLETMEPASAAGWLGDVPPDVAARVARRLSPLVGRESLKALPPEKRAQILAEFLPHLGAAVLRRLPEAERAKSLQQMSAEKRRGLELILNYPEGTVGSLMNPSYLALPDDLSIGEAIKRIQRETDDFSFYVFVVNRGQVLVGVVSIRDLLAQPLDKPLSAVMRALNFRLSALTDYRSVLSNPDLRRFNALPVTSEDGHYLGAVTEETLTELADEEAAVGRETGGSAGAALGELYRVGLFGLLHSIEPPPERKTAAGDKTEEGT